MVMTEKRPILRKIKSDVFNYSDIPQPQEVFDLDSKLLDMMKKGLKLNASLIYAKLGYDSPRHVQSRLKCLKDKGLCKSRSAVIKFGHATTRGIIYEK